MTMLAGKKILAIDDTPSIRTFLRISLQSQGADFHEAGTATDGLRLCNDIKPDLIVLDLGLPDRDGLDLLPDLRQHASAKIIILSVRKEHSTKETAFQRGANAYLTKPFLMENLIELINQQIA